MKFLLAPLAEFTDAPFRTMCLDGGADLVFTEMVSAAALAHGHVPTRRLLHTMPREAGRTVCQIFGAEESEIAFAAREAEKLKDRFVALDLNAGCPMPRIVRSGAGASLVRDPERLCRLLKAMKENTSLPVSVKTRPGPRESEKTMDELLDAAESAGASSITVHARFTNQMHGGPVHLDILAETAARAKIPVAGNGGVRTAADALEMAKTGVAAIMIGRAALPDPAVFAKLAKAFGRDGKSALPASPLELFEEHLGRIMEFRERLARENPEDRVPDADASAVLKTRTHLFRYFNGAPGAARLRKRLNTAGTMAEIRAAAAEASAGLDAPER